MSGKITRLSIVAELRNLACSLGSIATNTEWHLFGSVNRDDPNPSDIDLMIFCRDDKQADDLREAIDLDAFELPLHLSLLTFEEADSIKVTSIQNSTAVLTVNSIGICK
ncbi:TPA: nucleotidyltransferase domain-containing protein [Vibrio alginolyticus]|uniref:nucleotidyltransferase domain-containing protein n=1 Tax=Vibrio alginolyticus TaxID=663 RepID=UPI00215E9D40|nr:nucleotidyltransferase domain-containing protein [Vibrio alginolyticus]MCS0223021.1 nucleotidyltransferase domain-containing protein [Vibrio alginolyticus]WMO21526.1 nucleotidyltransferase domain-containing protein [Vibrio alginolyticus]